MNLAVMLPEVLLAPAAALGAVFITTNYAPQHMAWLTNSVAKNIIEPQIRFFDSLDGSLKHAHELHDKEKREEMKKTGITVPETVEVPSTVAERAHTYAYTMLKGSVALAADYVATSVGQAIVAAKVGAVLPKGLATGESILHVAGIMAMPTLFARQAENINHGISKRLRHTFGMEKQKAENLSFPFTYVTVPGQLAAVLALAIAHGANKMKGL